RPRREHRTAGGAMACAASIARAPGPPPKTCGGAAPRDRGQHQKQKGAPLGKQTSAPRPHPGGEKKRGGKTQRRIRQITSYAMLALLGIWLFQDFVPLAMRPTEIPYSEFKHELAAGHVTEVVVGRDRIEGVRKTGTTTANFATEFVPESDPKL